MFFFLQQEERALTDDGLAVGLEHGPAHHGSAHDDQIRQEPARHGDVSSFPSCDGGDGEEEGNPETRGWPGREGGGRDLARGVRRRIARTEGTVTGSDSRREVGAAARVVVFGFGLSS